MTHPARAMAFLGIAVILAILAPFQTGEFLSVFARFIYWLAVVVLSYCVGYVANQYAAEVAPDSIVKRIAIAGILTSPGAFLLVYLINVLALGYWASGLEFLELAFNVFVISVIISAIIQFAYASSETSDENATNRPAIFDRLPIEKRGQLVSLTVEDHYVKVRTTNGEEMVLMRLADAIREVGDTPGLQVHRSHWVAIDQVTSAARKGDGAILSMAHGPDIPVSRSNVANAKEAGLLPR